MTVTVDHDRPALGAFLDRPAVLAAWEHYRWLQVMSLTDYRARGGALHRLLLIHEAARVGRRLDLVAVDLRGLADELDGVPQRREGGWRAA